MLEHPPTLLLAALGAALRRRADLIAEALLPGWHSLVVGRSTRSWPRRRTHAGGNNETLA